jgi:exonuclease SbcC
MRFDRIRLKGLGPFRSHVDLDIAAADGPIVAVCGKNGAGKSTLLELLAGALYRECPTRGSLSSLATARDAFVEVEVENGSRFRIRQTVDHISGKGESVVLDAEGRPLITSAKRKDFDAWASAHLPAKDVLFSSVFSAQGSHGFLDMTAGERKAVLLRVLGIERLERLADAARERMRAEKSALDTILARLQDARARAVDPHVAEQLLDDARRARAAAEERVASAKAALEAGRKAVEADMVNATRRHALSEKASELNARVRAAKDALSKLDTKVANNQAVLANAEEIRAAAARLPDVDAELARVRQDLALAEASALAASKAAEDISVDAIRRRRAELARAIEAADMVLADRERVLAAHASLDGLRAKLAEHDADAEAIRGKLADVQTRMLSGKESRIYLLREGLARICDGQTMTVEQAREEARRTLECDSALAAEQAAAPGACARLQDMLDDATKRIAATRAELADAERMSARMAEIEAAEKSRAAALSETIAVDAELEAAREKAERHMADAAWLRRDVIVSLEERLRALEVERAALASLASKLQHVDKADARLAEYAAQRKQLETELADALSALESVSMELGSIAPPSGTDVGKLAAAVDQAEKELRSAEAQIAVREAALADAIANAKRIDDLDAMRTRAEQDVADWSMLASDLGRDGLQALEIDAAGPELSELANDLLHTCFGPRWTIAVETTRLSADGKRMLEGCDVHVVDTVAGREGAVETFSGGERVLLGEAVSLALTMLSCRRSGMHGVTLVRDETGAALDPTMARAYIAMVRRAAELVRADRVLLVSHSHEVQELCDSRIEVRDGSVSAVLSPVGVTS